MMMVNKDDPIRTRHGCGRKSAESMVIRNHPMFRLPVPAVGETVCKLYDKIDDDGFRASLQELKRLIDRGFFDKAYLRPNQDLFYLAREFSKAKPDDRETISMMDALIMATACVDPDCVTVYTSDFRLGTSKDLRDAISEYRKEHGLGNLSVHTLDAIIR